VDRMSMNEKCDEIVNARRHARGLSDSDRNIMAELRHEHCERHCVGCGGCISSPEARYCDDCHHDSA
jgi:hypothetical protein